MPKQIKWSLPSCMCHSLAGKILSSNKESSEKEQEVYARYRRAASFYAVWGAETSQLMFLSPFLPSLILFLIIHLLRYWTFPHFIIFESPPTTPILRMASLSSALSGGLDGPESREPSLQCLRAYPPAVRVWVEPFPACIGDHTIIGNYVLLRQTFSQSFHFYLQTKY